MEWVAAGRFLGLFLNGFGYQGERFCTGDAYADFLAGLVVALEGYRVVSSVPCDGGAVAVPAFFGNHVAFAPDPFAVVLQGDFLEGLREFR